MAKKKTKKTSQKKKNNTNKKPDLNKNPGTKAKSTTNKKSNGNKKATTNKNSQTKKKQDVKNKPELKEKVVTQKTPEVEKKPELEVKQEVNNSVQTEVKPEPQKKAEPVKETVKDKKPVKEEKKKSNRTFILLACLLAVVALISAIAFGRNEDGTTSILGIEIGKEKVMTLEEIKSIISEEQIKYIEEFDENEVYSSSFKGIIKFDSGLIDLPVVQSIDNDFYLRRDWKTNTYTELGSIFMDYECTPESKNTIIYGHHVASYFDAGEDENGNKLVNEELMFTPLQFLTDETNYKKNKTVRLILENEVRVYEIVSVFYCNLLGEGDNMYPERYLEYYLTEYDDNYFENYKKKIKQKEFYDTGVDFTNEDYLLTLQTCVENNSSVREIVLGKLVDTIPLERKAYEKYQKQMKLYKANLLKEQLESSISE